MKCTSYREQDRGVGRCIATKEIDFCSCKGDISQCDFYEYKRNEKFPEKSPMSPCLYCVSADDNIALNERSAPYSGIEMRLICNGTSLRARHFGDGDNYDHQDIIPINYCPMCGRYLKH